MVRAAFSSSRVPPAAKKSSAPLTAMPCNSGGHDQIVDLLHASWISASAEPTIARSTLRIARASASKQIVTDAALERNVFPIAEGAKPWSASRTRQ